MGKRFLGKMAGDLSSPRSAIKLGVEQASTSGTSIDFTSIPPGVKRITIMFVGVSTSGTDSLLVQIGDSGGFETAGYTSKSHNLDVNSVVGTENSSGFIIRSTAATSSFHGQMILHLEDSSDNRWTQSHSLARGTNTAVYGAGSKALSAELTQIRITTTGGTDTFDAGVINIQYE